MLHAMFITCSFFGVSTGVLPDACTRKALCYLQSSPRSLAIVQHVRLLLLHGSTTCPQPYHVGVSNIIRSQTRLGVTVRLIAYERGHLVIIQHMLPD